MTNSIVTGGCMEDTVKALELCDLDGMAEAHKHNVSSVTAK